MKTQNLIGALMMVSLSFTACQKSDLLTPSPALLSEQERIARPNDVGLPREQHRSPSDLLPLKIKDLTTGKDKLFFYDNASRLLSVKDDNKNLAFSYDPSGRVSKVEVTSLAEDRGEKRLLVMRYTGNTLKPDVIDEIAISRSTERLIKSTAIKYDHRLNKISEQDLTSGRSLLSTRTFAYDADGNCIDFMEIQRGAIVKHVRFSEFDNHPVATANAKGLELLPGVIIQRSNAQTVTELAVARTVVIPTISKRDEASTATNSIDKILSITHYKFGYNNLNFPTTVSEIKSDFEVQLQSIEYLPVIW